MNTEKLDETIEVIEDDIIKNGKDFGVIKADIVMALAELIKARVAIEMGEFGKELSDFI